MVSRIHPVSHWRLLRESCQFPGTPTHPLLRESWLHWPWQPVSGEGYLEVWPRCNSDRALSPGDSSSFFPLSMTLPLSSWLCLLVASVPASYFLLIVFVFMCSHYQLTVDSPEREKLVGELVTAFLLDRALNLSHLIGTPVIVGCPWVKWPALGQPAVTREVGQRVQSSTV